MLRCRSVCKTWNKLISGCINVTTAIHGIDNIPPTSTSTSTSTSSTLMLLFIVAGHETDPSKEFYMFINRVPRIIKYEEMKKHSKNAPLNSPEEDFSYGLSYKSIVGACDDMVCLLGSRREVVLWNQTTGLYSKVDVPPDLSNLSGLTLFGFGYDDYGHPEPEYKIVLGFYGKEPQIAIYGLMSREWKILQGPEFRLSSKCNDIGCFFVDSLHWMGPSHQNVIIRFSLRDEKFTLWPVYNKEEVGTSKKIREMGTYDHCLCYYSRIPDFGPITMWKMNDYGVTNSWTRVWTIQLEDPYEEYMQSIYAFQDGHILMVASGLRVFLYDLSKGRVVSELNDIQEAAIYAIPMKQKVLGIED